MGAFFLCSIASFFRLQFLIIPLRFINYLCAMTIEQHKELLKRVSAIQSYLKIEDKRMQLREE